MNTNSDTLYALIKVMENNGIYFYSEYNLDEEIELNSLTFIALIADIETEFEIIVSDEVLMNPPKTVKDFLNIIVRGRGVL